MIDSRTTRVWGTLPLLLAATLLYASCGDPAIAPRSEESDDAVGEAWFSDVAEQRGISFMHVSGASDAVYFPEIMGGGAAVFDVENDVFE